MYHGLNGNSTFRDLVWNSLEHNSLTNQYYILSNCQLIYKGSGVRCLLSRDKVQGSNQLHKYVLYNFSFCVCIFIMCSVKS